MNKKKRLEDWLEDKKWFCIFTKGWLFFVSFVIWFLFYRLDKISLADIQLEWRLLIIIPISLLVLFFIAIVVYFMGYLGLKIAMSLADSLPEKCGLILKTVIVIIFFIFVTAILLGVGPNRFDMIGRF